MTEIVGNNCSESYYQRELSHIEMSIDDSMPSVVVRIFSTQYAFIKVQKVQVENVYFILDNFFFQFTLSPQ